MPASCTTNPALARKNLSALLRALASVGQKPVADALEVSEATVSRLKSEHLEGLCNLLGVLGQKVVSDDSHWYSEEYIRSLRYFAKVGLERDVAIDTGDLEDEFLKAIK